jgi:hypothetical protein
MWSDRDYLMAAKRSAEAYEREAAHHLAAGDSAAAERAARRAAEALTWETVLADGPRTLPVVRDQVAPSGKMSGG